MNKDFRCPNCKEKMNFDGQTFFKWEIYDKWICEDCSHIIVLDFRGEVIND